MKIVLAALNAKYVHSNLAVYDLACYAEQQWNRENAGGKPEVVIREFTINQNRSEILETLYKEKATMIAFSCYIWNISEVLSVAGELSKVSPMLHIWLGGPEVSYNSVEILAKYPFVEGVIQGEGEATFYELACRLAEYDRAENAASSFPAFLEAIGGVAGTVCRDGNGKIVSYGTRPLLSLDEVPFVYDDLTRFQNKILYYETSRGCPFSCSYCLSSIDRTVRFRSMELVRRELQFFLDNRVRQVKFIDRTFNCNRERALAIWTYLLEHDNGVTNFHFEVAADLIGEAELSVFAEMRRGLIQLEIGLQTTNEETIKEIRRTMNIDKVRDALKAVRELGNIHQHLDLIAGLPYEDMESFRQSFNAAYSMQPNQLQLGFLKVLKGSYMAECVREYGLVCQDREPYEVLSTKWISYDEILRLKRVEDMIEVYYNSGQFEHVLSYLVPHWESPCDFYEELGAYYDAQGLTGIGFKRERRYEVLLDFCVGSQSARGLSETVLCDLLTFDYYLRENAKNRPSWSKEMPVDKRAYLEFFKRGGTEEVCLAADGYDSRQAARKMHIEPVSAQSLAWIMCDEKMAKTSGRDGKTTDAARGFSERVYMLFDYDNRDVLTSSAQVKCLSHL